MPSQGAKKPGHQTEGTPGFFMTQLLQESDSRQAGSSILLIRVSMADNLFDICSEEGVSWPVVCKWREQNADFGARWEAARILSAEAYEAKAEEAAEQKMCAGQGFGEQELDAARLEDAGDQAG